MYNFIAAVLCGFMHVTVTENHNAIHSFIRCVTKLFYKAALNIGCNVFCSSSRLSSKLSLPLLQTKCSRPQCIVLKFFLRWRRLWYRGRSTYVENEWMNESWSCSTMGSLIGWIFPFFFCLTAKGNVLGENTIWKTCSTDHSPSTEAAHPTGFVSRGYGALSFHNSLSHCGLCFTVCTAPCVHEVMLVLNLVCEGEASVIFSSFQLSKGGRGCC